MSPSEPVTVWVDHDPTFCYLALFMYSYRRHRWELQFWQGRIPVAVEDLPRWSLWTEPLAEESPFTPDLFECPEEEEW